MNSLLTHIILKRPKFDLIVEWHKATDEQITEWINQAIDSNMRQLRKMEAHARRYSSGPRKLIEVYKELE